MKKIIALLLVIALTAALSVSLTMAYLQDTDEDVNVMTLGNVYIEQHEYQRVVDADGSYKKDTIDGVESYMLESFKQGKPLYPIVGDPSSPEGYLSAGYDTTHVYMSQVNSYGYMDVFAGKNAQDKFVTVENTGKSAAYVRTLVALEIGEIDPNLLGTSYHGTWTKNYIGVIEIDGNKYSLSEYIYAGGKLSDGSWRHENGVLPAGETTYPSLSQVYLGADATNEDVEKLDGNKNGTFDILVLSQAVQAEGFESAEKALDAAFGDITTANHPWIDSNVEIPTVTSVSTAEELTAAIAEGGIVVLENNVVLEDKPITIAKDSETYLNLNGNTLSGTSTSSTTSNLIKVAAGGSLTIANGTVSFYATTPDTNWGGNGQPPFPGYANNTISCSGKLIIDGATIENKTAPGGASYAIDCYPGAELTINSGTIDGHGKTAIRMFANSGTVSTNLTVNGGTITGSRALWIQLPSSNSSVVPPVNVTINGGSMISTNTSGDYLAIYSYSYGNDASGVNVNITGGTFNGNVAFGGGTKVGRENVTVTGGTFDAKLGRYLASGGWEDIAQP